MKHIIMSNSWEYGDEPFPAYRCALSYGRHKNARAFLPVKNVAPATEYTVATTRGKSLYAGTDKVAAEAAFQDYASWREEEKEKTPDGWVPMAEIRSSHQPLLPEGEFRVIKTREKGTILVVPGRDNTDRCLLFIGCAGGFRGDVKVLRGATTGTVLQEASAGNACESSVEVAGLFEVGQSIVFHSVGRGLNQVIKFTWNGSKVEGKEYSLEEWNTEWELRSAAKAAEEEAEVL